MYIRHDVFNKTFWGIMGINNYSDVCGISYHIVAFGIISLQEIVILDTNFKDVQLFQLVLYEYCKLAGLRILESIPESVNVTNHQDYSFCPWSLSMGYSREGQPHLMPFVLPTKFCNSTHVTIRTAARLLIPRNCTIREAAARVRNFARGNICYVLLPRNTLASDTFTSLEGMCTNVANLQCAILRAAGIPCGYTLVNIHKDAYSYHPSMLKATLNDIPEVTIHCFCSVWDHETGQFLHFDGTGSFPERGKNAHIWLEEDFVSGESFLKKEFRAGPFSYPHANIDHLVSYTFPPKTKNDLSLQNEMFRRDKGNLDNKEYKLALTSLYGNAIQESIL